MRSVLHILSVLLLTAVLAWWWHAGANKGWTKTSVQIWKFDEITGISYPETEKRFVPGVEILAAACGVSVLMSTAGFLLRRRSGATRAPRP
jgi:hypothetical protein